MSSSAWSQEFQYFDFNQNKAGIGLPIPAASETPLFDRIARDFSDYRMHADDAASRVLAGNTLNVVGGLSGVGFSLVKNFGGFSINANRQLAPDLFDDQRWIIVDELTILIDAQGYLGELRDQEVIDISESNLAAFAGIAFKRVYRITHFANSYEEGLTKDYDKLVFPFRWFKPKALSRLEPYEYLEKEDALSFKAGGLVSAPVGYGLSVGAGILASFEKTANLTIQSIGPDDAANDPLQRIRLTYTSEKTAAIEAQARLQADFLGLLQLTLFSYDFSYSLSHAQSWNLSLDEQALHDLDSNQDPILYMGLQDVLKLKNPRLDDLAPYIVSSETRKTEIMKSKYAALIFGGRKEKRTEHVQTVKDGMIRSFFRHNFTKQRQVQNIVSRLVSELFSSLLKMPTLVNNAAIETKKVSFEYESVENLVDERKDLVLNDESSSMFLNIYHEASVSTKSKKMRDYFTSYSSYYTGADPAIISLIDQDGLRPPYQFQNTFQISESGVRLISQMDTGLMHELIDDICDTKPKNKMYGFRSLFNFCKWKLQKDYRNYILEVNHQEIKLASYKECKKSNRWYYSAKKKKMYLEACLRLLSKRSESEALNIVPLWRLKDFLDEFLVQSRDKIDVYAMFGLDNVHSYGQISASRDIGLPIRALFREGQWQGPGVIEAARVSNQQRLPASR